LFAGLCGTVTKQSTCDTSTECNNRDTNMELSVASSTTLHLLQYSTSQPYTTPTMKQIITFTGLAALTSAQTANDLPSCSIDCLHNGMTHVGCAVDDIKCACVKATSINSDITSCLESACHSNDEAKFRDIVTNICQGAGVPIESTFIEDIQRLEGACSHVEHSNGSLISIVALPLETPVTDPASPIFTGTIIIVPDDLTPCAASCTTTDGVPPNPTPITSTSSAGTATGPLKPSLPTFTNAAGSVRGRNVVAGLLGLAGLVL
jgi:hypothetical protein